MNKQQRNRQRKIKKGNARQKAFRVLRRKQKAKAKSAKNAEHNAMVGVPDGKFNLGAFSNV